MVKNPSSNVGDVGLIPGWGTRILHAVGQLSPLALEQGSPTPGLWTATSPWAIRKQAAHQEMSSGQVSKASLLHVSLRIACITA